MKTTIKQQLTALDEIEPSYKKVQKVKSVVSIIALLFLLGIPGSLIGLLFWGWKAFIALLICIILTLFFNLIRKAFDYAIIREVLIHNPDLESWNVEESLEKEPINMLANLKVLVRQHRKDLQKEQIIK